MAEHFDKPKTHIESFDERYERYANYFCLTTQQLQDVYQGLLKEFQRGLEMHRQSPNVWRREQSSLMFMDTCVTKLPTGREKGVYYGIDFGGTKVRAVRVELDGRGGVKQDHTTTNIKDVETGRRFTKGLLDKEATASLLFNAIASEVKKLMKTHQDDTGRQLPIQIGFTFSFAIDQRRINNAVLTGWSKDFETGVATKDPVVGRDVCALLDVALERLEVPAVTVAALNDTTGTMLSAGYEKRPGLPPCLLGVILGTGLNICYYQPHSKDYGYLGNVVNTEVGGFDHDLPCNILDIEVDYASTNRGHQRLEKMISGMYLPELCRRVILKVFQEKAPKVAWVHDSLSGAACAAIAQDSEDHKFGKTAAVLKDLWDWNPEEVYEGSLKKIQALVYAVFERSAALAAVAIAACATQTGRLQPAMGGVTVGVDGSLYTANHFYQELIRKFLQDLLDRDTAALIHFVIATDGSGKGAGILASTCLAKA